MAASLSPPQYFKWNLRSSQENGANPFVYTHITIVYGNSYIDTPND